ncbi:phage antirepressor KilAC domain-containing protein [Streptosporangium sp. NBC_01755]|uniref:phage antirepressor KilAC domain-containing protein n=1 Tax=Streptosporangium sp. NBC_01755 TaxID=2975949 RepID=UPI002DD96AB8|nr:phage antirepressor KilAC domain-containing protein [Streptosporangium sp. NBC_01755]WSD03888.1 phage antirepressor KilAC domain-containing protein [Streptosporangium sp. NBC_01755]
MPENTIAVPGHPESGSPFDAIRHEDENGEHWFARELQVVMGYEQWRRFEDSIDRAIRSAENTATYSEQAFCRIRQEDTGGAPRVDYRLNRYAAYLVAMNGDPNKPQVAAAQAYFAIKTREAENATSKPMTEIEMARKYLAVLEREQELSREQEVAKPKAGKWDAYCNSEGLIGMTELADILRTTVKPLTNWLVEISLFRRQVSQGGGGRNLPRATSQRSGHFEVKTETKNGFVFPVAYATPRGVDLVVDLWGRQPLP